MGRQTPLLAVIILVLFGILRAIKNGFDDVVHVLEAQREGEAARTDSAGLSVVVKVLPGEMSGAVADTRTGSLRYDNGTAPSMGWGPYPWAAGTRARSDGLTWVASDFASDGTHPNTAARQKVGAMLLTFFKTSPVTSY